MCEVRASKRIKIGERYRADRIHHENVGSSLQRVLSEIRRVNLLIKMDNAKKLRKYRKTDLSQFTFSKENFKAFTEELVADAQGSEVDRCLEDFVPEYAFNFYYWTIEPSYSSCVELLKRLGFDSDTEPKVIKIHDNPDYK
jgi:hypothetical protein